LRTSSQTEIEAWRVFNGGGVLVLITPLLGPGSALDPGPGLGESAKLLSIDRRSMEDYVDIIVPSSSSSSL